MQVRYLTKREHEEKSRPLYEEIFTEDDSAFVDAYYDIKGAGNQILVAEMEPEDGIQAAEAERFKKESRPVSMLHLNPYTMELLGQQFPAHYIVAVATRAEFRHRGLMSRLLKKALRDLYEEEEPFTFLMPASEAIYTPFDFRNMHNHCGPEERDWSNEQLRAHYELFPVKDAQYGKQQIPGLAWEKTPMMVRIVHLGRLSALLGSEKEQRLVIRVTDPILEENQGTFLFKTEQGVSMLIETEEPPELQIGIADLGSLLFGGAAPFELPSLVYYQEQADTEQKLLALRRLKRIYINEVV